VSSDDNELKILLGRIANRDRRESLINEVLRARRQAGVEPGSTTGRRWSGEPPFGVRARPHSAAAVCSPPTVASSSRPGWSAIRGAPSARRRCRLTSPTSSATASPGDGEKGRMFGAAEDRADAMAFARRCPNDRHHFRFVVTPEDAAEMADIKAFTRDLVGQMESDLGTRLDRVGIAHWNTDNPHVHLVVRVADDGSDLVNASGPRTWFRPSSAPGPSMKSAPLSSARWKQSAGPRLDAAIRMAADDIGCIATCGRTIRARAIRRRAVSS
jgi:hypothetical protein